MRNCVIFILAKYYSYDYIKNRMDGTCSTYGREERCIQVLVGNNGGKRPFGTPRRRRKILLKWMFKKPIVWLWTGLLCLRMGRVVDWIAVSQEGEEWWTGLLCLRKGQSGGLDCYVSGRGRVVDSRQRGHEISGSIKCGDLLDKLRKYRLLRKDSTPRS